MPLARKRGGKISFEREWRNVRSRALRLPLVEHRPVQETIGVSDIMKQIHNCIWPDLMHIMVTMQKR
eukprot:SAG11_NODE_469_length_9207_cov_5.391744_11_plen_67_part_00